VLAHSAEYLILLIVSATAFFVVPFALRWAVLCAAGIAFLWYASPEAVVVAIAMTLVNYFAALRIEKHLDTQRAYGLLIATITVDVGALLGFKYIRFLPRLFDSAHLPALKGAESLLLPLGISYYTFQCIGYLVEVYWGRSAAERHCGRLASSILFFPKLMAGPIERPHRFLLQLGAPTRMDLGNVGRGAEQVCLGVFRKCVIADRIGRIIDPVYKNFEGRPGIPLLVAIGLYTVQIYNDFSGYTDIALGTARIFGFELTPNFNRPFSARSVSEFWRRWHISLSSWTTDYVYKPLAIHLRNWSFGGSLAIVITFLVL